jgi:murein L,D-transpeptidase YcbB/YkuD
MPKQNNQKSRGLLGSGLLQRLILSNRVAIALVFVVGASVLGLTYKQYSSASSTVQYCQYHSVLSYGSTGSCVRTLQSALNADYWNNHSEVFYAYVAYHSSCNKANLVSDGDFGSLTKNHVVCFQHAFGLSADGIVGANTWARLEAECNKDQYGFAHRWGIYCY